MTEVKTPKPYLMHTEAPKNDLWKGYKIVGQIPAKFIWRANTYVFDKLTRADIEAMAKDTRMTSIAVEDTKPETPKA